MESKDKYNQLVVDPKVERDTSRSNVSNLQVRLVFYLIMVGRVD